MTDVDAIIAGVLAVPPGAFIAERNRRAAALPEPELARRIKSLRKPTAAVWIVNRLAARGQLTEAIELGQALQRANHDRDSTTLGSLNRERRALVARLAGEAADQVAAEHQLTVTASTRTDLAETLNAAIIDPNAAAAVCTGRLIRT